MIDHDDMLGKLRRATRNQRGMRAHDFYRICGLRPQTVRAARMRSRKRGEPDPVPLREGTYDVDLLAAIKWLGKTGRSNALIRLSAYFDDLILESASMMRGVRASRD